MKRRTADPYRDLDAIDARAPRFNQLVIGSLSLVAFLVDWWPLYAILAAQLALGLTLGRRWCLPCLAYFELIQPLAGEGPIEDSRPPRFANMVGFAFLSGAAIALSTGATVLGWTLGLMVAALALLAAATGLCIGCEVYRLVARARGIRSHVLERIDLEELGASGSDRLVVQFTHPLCTDCRSLERTLREEGHRVVTVDVSRRPELARKYGISVVPTAVAVGPDGSVSVRLAG
jgi:thiol-disulfide isomerase/thioredoxin